MVDRLSVGDRSALMRRIRSKDTKPELMVRRLLHKSGYRFRLHSKDLPGRPDIIFRRRRKVIFVHGCYWHGHGCARGGSGAKSNTEYWGPKISRTKDRDAETVRKLEESGWDVLVVWECQVSNSSDFTQQLNGFLCGQ